MSLKATNNVETNKYELEIEISAEDFEAAIEKAYLKARKNIAMLASVRVRLLESLSKRNTASRYFLRTL